VPEVARSERLGAKGRPGLAYGHYRVAISGSRGGCCTVFGGLVCWAFRPLILSLAANLTEEWKRSRLRRGEGKERENRGRRGHHHITNGSGKMQ
jgi:hypothetical protein